MPELPEVEHARQQLLAVVGGQRIEDARALDPLVVPQGPAQWRNALLGRRVRDAERIGKNVLAHLTDGNVLWFHLGMTGRLVRCAAQREAVDSQPDTPRSTRWWIRVPGAHMCLVDRRRLSRAMAGPASEVRAAANLDALGPDALAIANANALQDRFARARGPIKAVLMDQTRIAGLGNIQTAEILWLAQIHPETPVSALTSADWERLFAAMRESLTRSLRALEGTAEIVYVEEGGPNPFLVYDREGQGCPRCGAPIVREVVRGRPSYLCKRCQRRRGARSPKR